MIKTGIVAFVFLGLVMGLGMAYLHTAEGTSQGEPVYIVDRTGERWDITQAVSLGFKADGFQYGIGRNTIRPLDESSLNDKMFAPDAETRVIGVENGSEAHAYVIGKLTRHEIANTRLGEAPIAAAYWPLVDLAAVYSRKIDDRTLTLAPSGWTYNSTFVLYDKETGTLWYPYRKGLMGIQGPYFKRWLPKVASEDTRWDRWAKKHPGTRILR